MKRICRCHGMSESCSVQTCWTQLSDFREIGNYLKIKHSQAQKLDIDKKRMRAGNSADNRGAITDAFGSIAQTELLYLEDSPDYCRTNTSLGLYGTEGRECVQHGDGLTQWEKRSCRRLCHECGLRVEERRTEVVSSCNCKFHWCCKVNCDDCSQVIVKHVCATREGADGHMYRRKYRGPKWTNSIFRRLFRSELKAYMKMLSNVCTFIPPPCFCINARVSIYEYCALFK